jgi:tetratricopeptide (TPR) repeat protein
MKEDNMRRSSLMIVIVLVFLVGTAVGVVVAKKVTITPSMYMDKSPEEASTALLSVARGMAGSGSWENIHLARVYYLSDRKEEGQAILDRVLDGAASNSIRAGRLYYQAGEWDKARSVFDTVIAMKPKDADWLAEIGAYHNLQGDREKAEELFQRSFAAGNSLNNVLNVAGSYVGVTPRKR